METLAIILIIASIFLIEEGQSKLSCLDNNLSDVDWYNAVKVPDDFLFSYFDPSSSPNSPPGLQIFPGHNMNTTSSSVGGTINQVFQDKDVAYVAWNDECPDDNNIKKDGSSMSIRRRQLYHQRAHSKGVIAWDGESGFWLIHSVPKYPDFDDSKYSWSGDIKGRNAQSFLCISLDKDNIEKSASQVLFMDPDVCTSNMPSALSSEVPNLTELVNGGKTSISDTTSVEKISSVNGQSFTSFAKTTAFNSDLYEDLVIPKLGSSFEWQTWRRASGTPEDSYCKGDYDSENVLYTSFPFNNLQWHYTKDHSKYGISSGGSDSYICVGGINRMVSQRKRGGGTVCFENDDLHDSISASFSKVEEC